MLKSEKFIFLILFKIIFTFLMFSNLFYFLKKISIIYNFLQIKIITIKF